MQLGSPTYFPWIMYSTSIPAFLLIMLNLTASFPCFQLANLTMDLQTIQH